MDIFTLSWVVSTGLVGIYLGINALRKGEISFHDPLPWNVRVGERPRITYYLLTSIFLVFGGAILAAYFLA
ncbi:MAG: hypothetical protein AAFP92_05880 [Bacteroidota bacterium]